MREGDRQVPEGFYRLEAFNPNSRYHLSLRVNYPNSHDLKHARAEGRDQPGGDIMIHGKAVSVGCLAMGDRAIEDLFVLAARVGLSHIDLLLCPIDFRQHPHFSPSPQAPAWVAPLYKALRQRVEALPQP